MYIYTLARDSPKGHIVRLNTYHRSAWVIAPAYHPSPESVASRITERAEFGAFGSWASEDLPNDARPSDPVPGAGVI